MVTLYKDATTEKPVRVTTFKKRHAADAEVEIAKKRSHIGRIELQYDATIEVYLRGGEDGWVKL